MDARVDQTLPAWLVESLDRSEAQIAAGQTVLFEPVLDRLRAGHCPHEGANAAGRVENSPQGVIALSPEAADHVDRLIEYYKAKARLEAAESLLRTPERAKRPILSTSARPALPQRPAYA